jgi:hypothetical protein
MVRTLLVKRFDMNYLHVFCDQLTLCRIFCTTCTHRKEGSGQNKRLKERTASRPHAHLADESWTTPKSVKGNHEVKKNYVTYSTPPNMEQDQRAASSVQNAR